MRQIVLAILFWAVIVPMSARAENRVWIIPADKAECIRAHARDYAQHPSNPVVIIVDACPETDTEAALALTTRNTGVTAVGRGDSVLILSHDELRCLETFVIEPSAGGYVRIPKSLTCE